jgi:hypothetical protein
MVGLDRWVERLQERDAVCAAVLALAVAVRTSLIHRPGQFEEDLDDRLVSDARVQLAQLIPDPVQTLGNGESGSRTRHSGYSCLLCFFSRNCVDICHVLQARRKSVRRIAYDFSGAASVSHRSIGRNAIPYFRCDPAHFFRIHVHLAHG